MRVRGLGCLRFRVDSEVRRSLGECYSRKKTCVKFIGDYRADVRPV